MFITSRNPYLHRDIINALLDALSARPAAALLVTPFVHLYTARTAAPSQDSEVADFTEATFTGYAPVGPLAWTDEDLDKNKNPTLSADPATFVMTDNTVSESIAGYGLVDVTSGNTLVAVEQFASPVLLVYAGQGLEVTCTLKMSSTDLGMAVVAS